MPRQKPGESETIVRTPPDFLAAARKLLGITEFAVDLACREDNMVASFGVTHEMDSFTADWHHLVAEDEWAWLNPPYDDIAPWAEKCVEESLCGAHIAFLVPASVGSNWWRDFVHDKADVRFLNGRIQFLDKFGKPIGTIDKKTKKFKATPYPKDLALILYGNEPGYEPWTWRELITPEVK
jgi:hypothetical protein